MCRDQTERALFPWIQAGTMQSKPRIQNGEFRIQKKYQASRGYADLKKIFRLHSPFRDCIPSPEFWMLDSGLYCIFPAKLVAVRE